MKEMASSVMDGQQAKLLNVLLVEDNLIDARLISGLLKGPAEALKCRHVNRLAEALQLLRAIQFDVILLDLNLEDSAGYETFSRILPQAAKAAILVLSGSDDEDLAIRTVREGAQDYLVKGSFDGRLLLRAIRYAFERKQSEEALRQSESTVRAIFENSLDGIVITEDRGICQEANSAAATLVGLSREEFIGSSLFKFAVEGLETEWRGFRENGSGRARFWIRRHDGVKRLVDCSFNANIMPGRHLCVLRDITEQQSLEEQLGQARKMEAVGRLAGGVAHDFNNILGIIGGYAELLELNSTDEGQRAKAEKILVATQKAASLTKQLLAFGRRQVMSPKLLDLSTVVAEVNSMVHCLVGPESQVIVHAHPDLGLVNADQGQLEQVILNLAANARDAMPNGGTLTMAMDNCISRPGASEVPPGEYVRLSVTDSGTGMEPEIESRIFEPFFTTKKSGSGLGLSTVYGIVKQSGGHITVHSELDVGSTFNIYLPLITSPRLKPPKIEGKKRVDLEGHETILLVDDEDDLRNAAGEYLENCGYRVLKACNGKEAIEMADKFQGQIGLVITDIIMPKVNGRGVVDHIKKTRPETNILVISGYADDAIIRHGIFLET
ncbi:MAG TPA: response regulator, partial [Candidatus Angelobacter sp.]|nr:response regulator [Candidatus Angelobacter sp.]